MEVALPMMALVVLICIGMPIAYALGVTGAVGAAMAIGWIPTLGVLQTTPYRTAANFLLSTIPLFILMAELLARGTVVQAMFRCAYAFVGHLRGGLALAAVGANAGFAALSGSSTAAWGAGPAAASSGAKAAYKLPVYESETHMGQRHSLFSNRL